MMKTKILIVMMILIMLVGSVPVNAKTKPKTFQETLQQTAQIITKIIQKYLEVVESVNLIAEVIYWENWYTDKERKTARWTGGVVMNRVKSPNYPNTVKEVLYQKHPVQYSTTEYFFTKELPKECYEMAWDIYLNGVPEMPDNVVYQATFKQGSGEWKNLNGESFCYE